MTRAAVCALALVALFSILGNGATAAAKADAACHGNSCHTPAPTPTATATPTPTPTATPTPTPTTTPPPAGVQAPLPPTTYTLPATYTLVSTSAELNTELGLGAHNIVLACGTYANSGYFSDANRSSIYAQSLGCATLTSGISIGSNWASNPMTLQGLAFNVSVSANGLNGAVVSDWNLASGTRLLDTTIDGNNVMAIGYLGVDSSPNGLDIERVVATNFTYNGIQVSGAEAANPPTLSDLDISNVSATPPGSWGGTAETCLWVANTSTVNRVKARNCYTADLWTGANSGGSTLTNIDLGGPNVGVYFEHYSYGNVLQTFVIGADAPVRVGTNCEWNDPQTGGLPACNGNFIEDGTITSGVVGVNLDAGTTSTTVQRVTFIGQCWAAIGNNQGVNNAFLNNDYSQIDATAVPVNTNNLNTAACN